MYASAGRDRRCGDRPGLLGSVGRRAALPGAGRARPGSTVARGYGRSDHGASAAPGPRRRRWLDARRRKRMTHRTTPERYSAIAAPALAAAVLLLGAGISAALAQGASSERAVDVAATISFTEGPTVDADGAVYFTDLRGAGRILKMDARRDGHDVPGAELPRERSHLRWRVEAARLRGRQRRRRAAAHHADQRRDGRGRGPRRPLRGAAAPPTQRPDDRRAGAHLLHGSPRRQRHAGADRRPRRLPHRPRRRDRPHPDRAGGRAAQRPGRRPPTTRRCT